VDGLNIYQYLCLETLCKETYVFNEGENDGTE